jgi:hypothetical protein
MVKPNVFLLERVACIELKKEDINMPHFIGLDNLLWKLKVMVLINNQVIDSKLTFSFLYFFLESSMKALKSIIAEHEQNIF